MADRYAGVAGATVGIEDGFVVLDVSTPERPEYLRFRFDRDAARELALVLLEVSDGLPT